MARMTYRSLSFVLVLLAGAAFGADDGSYDARTIRAADLPLNPPRFEQYPATKAFLGRIAPADVKTQPQARMFRTRISEGAKTGPNFAGHFTVVRWGCGMDCVGLAVVDANSGKVYFPPNLGNVDRTNIAYDDFELPDGELIRYKLNSRLLVVIGGINEDPARRGISYFVWEHGQLRRIRFVAKPYE